MTTYTLEYRMTLYAPRSVDPTEATILTPPGGAVHSDQFKVTTMNTLAGWKPYLGFPRGRTGRVNALDRTTDVGTMTFEVTDAALVPGTNANRWVSAFLGNANGDPQLGGLRCFVEESLDGGTNWTAYWTGHVKSLALSDRRTYSITVRDMTYELTKLPLFNQPPHATVAYAARPYLMPLGMSAAYGVMPATADLAATIQSPIVIGGSTLANVALVNMTSASIARKDNFVTKNLLSAVAPNTRQTGNGLAAMLGPSLPNFKGTARAHLTWNAGANHGDFRVGHLNLSPYAGGNVWLNFFSGLGHGCVNSFYLSPLEDTTDLEYSALPANGTAVTCRIFAATKMVEGAALLIDVANPLTMLADVLNGKFGPIWVSPEVPPPGKVFGDVHRSFTHAVSSANQPELAPLRLVIDKPVDNALEWIQKQLLKPYGLALVADGAGSFSVVDLRIPSSLGGIPTITDADVILGDVPSWEFDRDQAVYRAEGVIWEDFVFQLDELKNEKDKFPEFSKLLLSSIDHPQIQLAIGQQDFGDKAWNMGGDGYRTMEGDGLINNMQRGDYMAGKIKEQQDLIRRPFAHGATSISLPCRRTSTIAALVQGQVVQVNVSTLPNPSTGKRGASVTPRLCRITEISRNLLRADVKLLDLGISTVTGVPTLGAPALGSDPRHTATIAVTLNAGIWTEIRFALTVGGSAPIDADPGWRYWENSPVRSSQTITLTGLTPGMRLWVQARSMPFPLHGQFGVPSAWVTSASLDLTAYAPPSGITVTNLTARAATINWTLGTNDVQMEVWLRSPDSGAYTRVATLPAGSTSWNLMNLTPNTQYGVLVQGTSMHGMVSASVSTSFTTPSGDTIFIGPRPPIISRYKRPLL